MTKEVDTIKKTTIHFMYSFMPSSNDFTLNERDIIRLTNTFSSLDNLKSKVEFNFGKPENERTGISAYNSLRHENIGFINLPSLLVSLNTFSLSIDPMFRFFPNGSILTFKVKTRGAKTSQKEIHQALQLVSQIKNKKAKKVFSFINELNQETIGFYKELFDIDTKDKEEELENIYQQENSILEIKYTPSIELVEKFLNEKKEITLFELFKGLVKKILLIASNDPELEHPYKLKCKEFLNSNQEEPRTPWIVTVLDVEGELAGAFCPDQPNISLSTDSKQQINYSKLIAPILYRSVTEEDFSLEPSYLLLPKRMNFFNINLDSRLYVDISRRSILCISKDQNKNPGKYFIPVLLDISEMTFSRWQSLLIINKIIDEALKNFKGDNNEYSLNAKERVERIMNLIIKFSSCLEDMSNYFIGGDALREIHDKLLDNFKIDDLLSLTLSKIDMLEKYYKYSVEISWAKRY